jgi:hypothetical protein
MVCASARVKTVQSSFQPIMGVMPIMARICARVLLGKMSWIWSAEALKDTIEACARVDGVIMVLTLLAPKVMVMAFMKPGMASCAMRALRRSSATVRITPRVV